MIQLSKHEPGVPITAPGLYAIDDADYHADALCETPSLSSTIARLLLDASPKHAWAAHPRLNPDTEEEKASTLDVGSAMHAMLLGHGRDIVALDFPKWSTNASKEARDSAREAGKIPLLKKDFEAAQRLVAIARVEVDRFPELAGLFDAGAIFEQTAIWREGVLWCRAKLDILRVFPEFIAIVDFKSTDRSAAPDVIGRQVFNMGYDVQLAFYRRGLRRVLGPRCPPIRCFLMSQERAGPGALSIVEPDEAVLTLADKKVSAALKLWQTCLERDEWPSYPPFIASVSLPPWVENRWLEREVNDDALAGAGWAFAMPLPDDDRSADPRLLAAG
ncbi:hypothetical protein ASG43_03140 [Aureimonas sp. Leaf454]|uniref:PD-(D/E)XK nuclease-like domain-containing protein n=1 Tax=Aureimonas sp. Leaf454 TaxID=1736381 RepID=UPI000713DA15|nr:PD-(D/E)XK nuclease-like domain-containing protein [Aureimonas sp. Leaf454]KQT54594.1 hypothetical protein ASG43_03140 [Aureimonas sp. Leaf454]